MRGSPPPRPEGAAYGQVKLREGGFTLLEVLVAFIIMSIALAALMRSGSQGLRGVDIAAQTEIAVALAQSRLRLFRELGESGTLDRQGDDGPYHWRLQVVPLDAMPVAVIGRSRPTPTVLYQVLATISWASQGRRSSIRLDTRRLSPVPPVLP